MSMLPLLTPKLPLVPDRRKGDSEAASARTIFEGIEQDRRSRRDRRATPRVAVMLNLELENHDAAGGGLRVVNRTHDISAEGVSIRSGPTPAKGSLVKLRIFVTDESPEPITLNGEVLGPFDALGGVRVKFVKPAPEHVARLQKFFLK